MKNCRIVLKSNNSLKTSLKDHPCLVQRTSKPQLQPFLKSSTAHFLQKISELMSICLGIILSDLSCMLTFSSFFSPSFSYKEEEQLVIEKAAMLLSRLRENLTV